MSLIDKVIKEEIKEQQKIVEWPSTFVHSVSGKVYKPHNEQEIKFVYEDTPPYALLKGSEGSGKGHTLDTIIPTPTGYKTMGEIEVGDEVFSERGEIIKVTHVHPVRQIDCYEITFDTNEKIVVDKDHLWAVETYKYRNRSAKKKGYYELPDFENLEVADTQTIFENQRAYRNRANYSVPLAKPLQLPTKVLPIDPYVVGSWLGDGTSRGPYLTVGNEDIDNTTAIYNECGYSLTKLSYKYAYRINSNDKGQLLNALRQLNILQNKHIPISYMFASYDQRLALLQGLMDTDGCIDDTGSCEFDSSDDRLAQDFQNLCFSLGIKTSFKKSYIKYNGSQRKRYRFCFNPNIPVFRLTRKLNLQKNAKTQQARKQRRYITNVKMVSSVPTKCITVDNPTSLYLCTKNLIPTHNSVALIIKILNRLRRGCSGAVLSPNMPSFRRSLFPELLNWMPRSIVIEGHQRYFYPGWRPRESFIIVVHNELGGFSELLCASAESPRLLEGPNLNFVAMDEIRGMPTSEILKVMSGRTRIEGPNGIPPQLFASSTPAMHWMFDFFGPIKPNETPEMLAFKKQCFVGTITLRENIDAGNLPEGFFESRSAVLTESEKLVRLYGEWHDEDNPEKFVPDMLMWDNLFDPKLTPPRPKRDPNRNWSDAILLAIDASVSRDYTALVGVTRDPNNRSHTCVRICRVWEPIKGGMIDFMAVQNYITEICKTYHVVQLIYDSFQMEQMAQNLFRSGVVAVKRFAQQNPRTLADQFLFDSILTGTISHMNDPVLRQHIDNANVKLSDDMHQKRIIKRADSLKIDAAVALSMANYECSRLNI